MNKQACIIFFLSCLFFYGCVNYSVTRPAVLVDVEEYSNDGMRAYANAEWGKAQRFFNKALLLYQGIDNQEGILLSSINLTEVSLALHHYSESKQHLMRAAKIAKYDKLQSYSSRITLLYGVIALQQNKLIEAEKTLQSILPVFEDDSVVSIPDTIQLSAIASRTRIAFLKNKDDLLWTRRYESALKKTNNQDQNREARLLRFQSELLFQQQGATDEAESKMLQALSLYKKNLSRVGIAVTLFELGQYYKMKQRWVDAQDYLNRSKAVYTFLGNDQKVTLITRILDQVESNLI